MCQDLGIENKLIPRIATAFAGGMARQGEVCGAVVGALMCIGIKHGREAPEQVDDEAMRLAAELVRSFKEKTGSLYCRELTGHDLTTQEGVEAYRASDAPMRVCIPAVGFAYEKTLELLPA